jgi:ribosomal RNA-processing protein 1
VRLLSSIVQILFTAHFSSPHVCLLLLLLLLLCRTQADLAERLAGLIPSMQPGMAVLYWSAMLHTLRSEWFALDRHRLNKFLMLVRKFVAAVFKRLAAQDW